MKKTKRYADGGGVNAQAPTYPFGLNNPTAAPMPGSQGASGMNQTFNISPTAQAEQPVKEIVCLLTTTPSMEL